MTPIITISTGKLWSFGTSIGLQHFHHISIFSSLLLMLTIAITMGQSEPVLMITPVGRFVHRMGWMIHLFSSASLPYINQHSITINFLGCWSLIIIILLPIFSQPYLHTTHPPSYAIDLNLNPTYKPTYYFEKEFDYLENVCAKQMEQRNWMTTLRKKIRRLQSSRWWNVRWCHVLNNALFILKQKEKKWPS